MTAMAESFTALTVTEGEGTLSDGESILSFRKGDTLFIPAQETSFAVTGACEMILSRAN
jgi:mannose-6-phosphate isomerase